MGVAVDDGTNFHHVPYLVKNVLIVLLLSKNHKQAN